MELAARAGAEPAAFRSAWLWLPLLCIGLAAALAGPLPPGDLAQGAKAAVLRFIGGGPAPSLTELAAVASVGGWMAGKLLCIVGAILWLEYRFSPPAGRRNLLLAWALQTISVSVIVGLAALPTMLGLLPEPLVRVEGAAGAAALLLVTLPAFLFTLLVTDFLQYWQHRALHRFAFLWRFHSLHHSIDLDVLGNVSHPVDHLIALVCTSIPMALLIGVSQEQLYLLVAFTSLQVHINHTRLPIHLGPLSGRLLCDRRYHYIHHSRDPAHRDKNFADRFPVFDMLFGTYVAPGERLPEPGLADRLPPRSLGEYLTVRLPERAGVPAAD